MNVQHKRLAEVFTTFAKPTTLLLVAIAVASCSGPGVDEQIETARQDYVAFDFLAARDGFAAALDRDPDNAEAAFGYARTLLVHNKYRDALPAFELAVELAPNNPQVLEDFLYLLEWGGARLGRRDWLDRAIEAGTATIAAFPDRVRPYESVEGAVSELNEPERWLQILSELATNAEGPSAVLIDQSFVFRIHLLQARLTVAQSSEDEDEAAAIRDELREELAAVADAERKAADSKTRADPGRQYFLASGHKLLEDTDAQRSWLARLDETPEGRLMGTEMAHYVHYYEFLLSDNAPFKERLEIIEGWKARFWPAWETDNYKYYRSAVGLEELRLLIGEARRQREEDGRPSEEILDRIVEIGTDLLNPYSGHRGYEEIVEILADLNVRLEEAVGFADEVIAQLNSDAWIARLEFHRGRALVGLDRYEEAEQAFRKATDLAPNAERLAAFGDFLAERGPDEQAYRVLVSALAYNAENEQLGSEADHVREAALETGLRIGRDEAALEADLEDARVEAADAERRRVVDNRLDRESPDFNLTDTHGNEWRLSDLRGKVVILNYWATWCGPCRSEFPHYQDLVDSYASADDVGFLAITTDKDPSETREFLDETGYRFTVLFDKGSEVDFRVNGLPTHIILGPEGRIQYKSSGFPGAERYTKEMHWRIEALRVAREGESGSAAAPSGG